MKTKQIHRSLMIMLVVLLTGCSTGSKKEEVKTEKEVSTTCKTNVGGADTTLQYDGENGILTKITNVSEMNTETFLSMYAQMYGTTTVEETIKAMEDSIKDVSYISLTVTQDGDTLHIEQINNIAEMSKEEFQNSQFITLGNYQEIVFDDVIKVAEKTGFTCE